MRAIGAFLLFSGFLGSFSTGQEPAATKTPDTQPKESKSNPPINQAKQPTKAQEAQSAEVFLLTKDTPDITQKEWAKMVQEYVVLEIRDISLKDFIGKIKNNRKLPIITLAESAEKAMLPLSIVPSNELVNYVVSLDAFMNSIEFNPPIKEGVIVYNICAKVNYSSKPKTLFIPVNLNEILKNEKFTIKTIEDVIRKGVDMDEKMRGSISTTPLVMSVHQDTGLLFLGGQVKQVEVACTILAALGGQSGVTVIPSEWDYFRNRAGFPGAGGLGAGGLPGGLSGAGMRPSPPPPTTSPFNPSRIPPPPTTSPNFQKKGSPAPIPQPNPIPQPKQ